MTDKTKKPALDLSSLDASDKSNSGVEIELRHPVTNAPVGIFITVLGKESETFREFIRERSNAAIRKKALADRRGKDSPPPTAEEMEASATDLLIACTVGWRSGDDAFIMFEGKPLDFTVPNARLIYDRLAWVRTQVDEAIGTLELFI